MKQVIVIAVLIAGATSLSCFCDYQNLTAFCGDPPKCQGSVVSDVCGCCDACAKVKGEKCGGPWDTSGKCDKGLVCHKQDKYIDVLGAGSVLLSGFNIVGICRTHDEVAHITSKCLKDLQTFKDAVKNGGTSCQWKPQCTPDGHFRPKQCDGCATDCWCVESTSGDEVPKTRGAPKTVKCSADLQVLVTDINT